MKKNMAVGDRFMRLLLSVVLVYFFFAKNISAPANFMVLVVAWILLVTGLVGICPMYRLFRIDTRQFKY